MRIDRIVVLGVAVLAWTACSEQRGSVEVADWVVASAPSTTIGELDGEAEYLFQRVVDAAFLGDGKIVVADAGLSALRIFEQDGSFVAETGRAGDGPGEFRSLRDVWVTGSDTVVAWDPGTLRLTYVDRRGSVVRSVGLQPSMESAGVGNLDVAVGPLSDGSVALASVAGAPGRVGPDRMSVERFSAQGAHLERVAEATGLVRDRLGERGSAPVPFSPFPHFATRDQSVYFTNGASPQVTVWSDGSERHLRFPPTDVDTQAAWDALVRELEGEGHEFFRSNVPNAPRPDSIPHLAGLIVDDAGRVWVKRFEPTADAIWLGGGGRAFGGMWWVSDAAGNLVARVDVPPELAPIEVVGDLLLGVTVDALGVERVQVHRVDR